MAKLRYLDLSLERRIIGRIYKSGFYVGITCRKWMPLLAIPLKTRLAYKWLLNEGQNQIFMIPFRGEITRNAFYRSARVIIVYC